MNWTIQLFVLFEGATFVLASLIHRGVPIGGYEHAQAATAEAVIAAVLLVGLVLSWVLPAWTRPIDPAVQGFALLGTLVGVSTFAIGVGPRTVPDVAYHLAILVVLAWGLAVVARAPAAAEPTTSAAAPTSVGATP